MGYADFSTYFNLTETNDYIIESSIINDTDDVFFGSLIRNFMAANLTSYTNNLSEMRTVLFPYLFCESPYLARLLESRRQVEEKNLTLVVQGNRSSCELITSNVSSNNLKTCICDTQEYWHMVFACETTGDRYIYNKSLSQTYFFQQRDHEWKIWNNYNPDLCSFVKETKLNTLL